MKLIFLQKELVNGDYRSPLCLTINGNGVFDERFLDFFFFNYVLLCVLISGNLIKFINLFVSIIAELSMICMKRC